MSEQYNRATAFHYSSYRPPLHGTILDRVLLAGQRFDAGLDVGCGTGYSAVALTQYCTHVVAIDPSSSMLDQARPHERITYRQGAGDALPVPDRSVDIVTFAGSLFYAKSAALIEELKRVCRPDALLVPYDFEILLDDILLEYGIRLEPAGQEYDHEINFSDVADFVELARGTEQVHLDVTAEQVAHVLLACSDRYEAFAGKYRVPDPFPELAGELERPGQRRGLKANIFFSKYRMKPEPART